MTSFGEVDRATVVAMLENCAPGYSIIVGQHNDVVRRPGMKEIGVLPKGRHGDRRQRVQLGHVKKLVRSLKIQRECAEEHIPAIGDGTKASPKAALLRCAIGQAKWHSNEACPEWPWNKFKTAETIPSNGFHCADCQELDDVPAPN